MNNQFISSGFSLIELLIVILIIGILLSIGVPSYHQYIIRSKMLKVLSLADAHKLKIIEGIIHGNSNESGIDNHIINEPNELVTKLEYAINHSENKYILRITPNIENLGIKLHNNQPLILELRANQDLESNMIYWNCQYTKGYTDFMPKHCKDSL